MQAGGFCFLGFQDLFGRTKEPDGGGQIIEATGASRDKGPLAPLTGTPAMSWSTPENDRSCTEEELEGEILSLGN